MKPWLMPLTAPTMHRAWEERRLGSASNLHGPGSSSLRVPGPHPGRGSSLPGSPASLAAAIGSILPAPADARSRPRNAAPHPGGFATSGLPGFRLVTVQEVHLSLSFHSILFDEPGYQLEIAEAHEPAFFPDLNLNQVVESVTAGRQEYDLTPFFYTSLRSVEAVTYRHGVLRDLAGNTLFGQVESFAQKMRTMRQHLSQAAELRYKYQQERWFLDAAEIYCDAVTSLACNLALADLGSHGFLAFRDYLLEYTQSSAFTSLAADTKALKEKLSGVRYCLHILSDRIKVSKYDSEADYGASVAATFERFKQGSAQDYRVKFISLADMDHVEAGVLGLVAQLYPDIFSALNAYCDRHRSYLDRTVATFDREVQFYVAYLDFIARFRKAGLDFCYPQISGQSKEIVGRATFDVALASTLVPGSKPIVCNDFYLSGPERIFVVSGPNQGGKTTFARTFGQMHYLATIGCPVPGSEARLLLFDRLFTHFERGENLQDLSGKLQDDLIRSREILQQATADSIVIMNEIFTSTTLNDAILLGTKVLETIISLDALCVWVTFVDELASLSESTVSVVSTVVPEDPAVRTYKIVRRPADGLAYAAAIAEKHGLTYESLMRRIAS
jgi:DNA mismatch repair ATPase MutS